MKKKHLFNISYCKVTAIYIYKREEYKKVLFLPLLLNDKKEIVFFNHYLIKFHSFIFTPKQKGFIKEVKISEVIIKLCDFNSSYDFKNDLRIKDNYEQFINQKTINNESRKTNKH